MKSEHVSRDVYNRYRQMDNKSVEGRFLVYDCYNLRFVCIGDAGNRACRLSRQDFKQTNMKISPCLPLKEFQRTEECVIAQYKRIYSFIPSEACANKSKIRVIRDLP